MNNLSNDNLRIYERYRRGKDFALVDRCLRMKQRVTVQNGRVLDIDRDSTMLELFDGFEKVAIDVVKRQFPKEIDFRAADISQGIPFSNNQFDVVIGGEIIEHLLDTERFVAEIYRVLKTGGEVVLSTPNMAYWRNIIQIAVNQNPFWVDWKNGQEGHVRYFAPAILRELMNSAGFANVTVVSIQDVFSGNNSILRMIGRIMQAFSHMHNMLLIGYGKKI